MSCIFLHNTQRKMSVRAETSQKISVAGERTENVSRLDDIGLCIPCEGSVEAKPQGR
jgi:hypothetical protein